MNSRKFIGLAKVARELRVVVVTLDDERLLAPLQQAINQIKKTTPQREVAISTNDVLTLRTLT